MTIYIPNASGSGNIDGALTFASGTNTLLRQVDVHLQNYAFRGHYAIVLDTSVDSATVIDLPHRNIVVDSVSVTGTTLEPTLDYDAGILVFPSALPNGASLKVEYVYRYWSEEQVKSAIQNAVGSLYPAFYIYDVAEVATNSSTYEYDAPRGTEVIRKVERKGSSDVSWKRVNTRRYEVNKDGMTQSLRFYVSPGDGKLRLHTIQRPLPFEADDQNFADIGLPDRAGVPVVFHACWELLKSQVGKRTRLDTAFTTQSGQQLSPRQLEDAAEAYRLAWTVELASRKMTPWSMA